MSQIKRLTTDNSLKQVRQFYVIKFMFFKIFQLRSFITSWNVKLWERKVFLIVWMLDVSWFFFQSSFAAIYQLSFRTFHQHFMCQVLMKNKNARTNVYNNSQFRKIYQCLISIILNCKSWRLFKQTHHHEFLFQCQFHHNNQCFFSNH